LTGVKVRDNSEWIKKLIQSDSGAIHGNSQAIQDDSRGIRRDSRGIIFNSRGIIFNPGGIKSGSEDDLTREFLQESAVFRPDPRESEPLTVGE